MALTRRRLAIALVVVGALALLAAAGSWLIVRVWGPSLTASQIAAAITEATERPAHVDHVVLEPLRGRVRISGLTVSGDAEPMARVEHIDVGIHIESLWRLELVIGVTVQGADVHLRPDPTAPPPAPFEMPERFQIGPITARLAAIRAERSRLRFEDAANGLTLGVDGLAAEGRPDRGGLELTARADTFHLRVANFEETLARLSAGGRIDAARILARRLDAHDGRHEVAVAGSIEAPWSKDPTLTGTVKAHLALGPVARSLGATVGIDGTAAVDLTLAGALARPVVAGRLAVERLDVAGIEARDLSASLRLDEQAFTVADVAGRTLGGGLRGSLTMPLGRPNDTLVRFRLDGAEAGALARLGGGTLDVRGRLTLDGEARGDLARPPSLAGRLDVGGSELSLPGDLARLGAGTLRASARMAAGQITSEVEARWPSASLTARGRVEPDQRLRAEGRATAELSALPGWGQGDSIAVTTRAEGRWPQVALTAGADLSRPALQGDAGRVALRLDPVAGGAAPRWSGSIRSRRLALPWVDIENLDGTLALSTEALEVSRVAARVATIPLVGSGRWAWRGAGAARMVAGPSPLARLPGVPPDLAIEGSARAQIEMTVGAAGAQGTARVDAERVAVATITLGRGTGEATLQGRRLEASLKFPERQLQMTARGELAPGQTLAARLELGSFDLASLALPPRAVAAPSPPGTSPPRPGAPGMLSGAISASADLAIPVDEPRALTGALTLRPMTLAVAGTSWSSASPIVARIDGQRATLEPARLAGPAGTITAGGLVWDAGAPPLVSVALDARLAALAPALGIDGRARAEVQLSGDAGSVAGAWAWARIDGDGITLPGALAKLGPGTSHADLRLVDGVVSIAKGEVAFPGLAGEVAGRIDLDGRAALDARVTARAEQLGPRFGLSNSTGTAMATASLRGALSQLDARARLASERLVVAGVAIEKIDAAARLQGETLRLERLIARVLGAPLRAHGEWTPRGAGRAELEAGPLDLAQVQGLHERLALAGVLSLRAEATMQGGGLKALASAQVKDARAAGLTLGAGRLTARVDGRRLQANFDLAERRITGSASGIAEPGGAIDAALDIATLELAPMLRHLSAKPDLDIESSVAGRLTARMPWDRPGALVAQARLDPIALRLSNAGVDGKGHLVASWENRALRLEQAELSGSAGTARASGRLGADRTLDAELEARVPLPAVLGSVGAVSGSEGTVTVRAQATGTLADPSVRGEGSLTGGRIALRGLAAPLRDITARVVATAGSIRIADATAALGSGSLRATGEAALAGRALGVYRVRLTGRDVPLRPLEGLDTLWNAELELAGAGERALLSGEVRLVRGTYSRDLVTLSALTAPEQAAAAKGTGLPLSIRARLDDNLLVRTSMARMRVGGTLDIRGTTAAPIVLGALEARDGTLILRGQRYQLERAVVRFADPRRIDPVLDVTATARIGDYDVTMRVTGHIRDLDMRLSSSPSLPRDRLLSLVAFGSTGGETALGGGGAVAGEAAALVIRELLDLSGGGENRLPGPLRTIMERTRVSYTHSSEDIGRFGFRVEYEVAGPFLLVGERTSQGYYVIDGVVRLRFR